MLIGARKSGKTTLSDWINGTKGAVKYPPGFAKSFRMPVLGVITKSDQHMERRGLSTQQLKRAGIAPPYYCVTKEEENFLELKKVIMQLVKRGEA